MLINQLHSYSASWMYNIFTFLAATTSFPRVVYIANQFIDFNWLFTGSNYSNIYSKCIRIVKISNNLIIKFELNIYGIRIIHWYLWEGDI